MTYLADDVAEVTVGGHQPLTLPPPLTERHHAGNGVVKGTLDPLEHRAMTRVGSARQTRHGRQGLVIHPIPPPPLPGRIRLEPPQPRPPRGVPDRV